MFLMKRPHLSLVPISIYLQYPSLDRSVTQEAPLLATGNSPFLLRHESTSGPPESDISGPLKSYMSITIPQGNIWTKSICIQTPPRSTHHLRILTHLYRGSYTI